jgi:hypothetical protein
MKWFILSLFDIIVLYFDNLLQKIRHSEKTTMRTDTKTHFAPRLLAFSSMVTLVFALIAFHFPQYILANNTIVAQEVYTYEVMTEDIQQLAKAYPELVTYHSLGKTPYGREIWAIRLGTGEATVFINGSHHAREWISSYINMKMVEEYAKAYHAGTKIGPYNPREILNKTSIWFVPMVTPDGVTLQQKGLSAFPKEVHSQLIQMNKGSRDFSRWKANINGVDLNRQYSANWDNIKSNVPQPSSMNHKGKKPIQELETKLLVDFTHKINPEITVSYHSTGRIIFWHFNTKSEDIERDRKIATQASNLTGYRLVAPTSNPSGGGYKDWFIQQFSRPALTLELVYANQQDSSPLHVFDEEWKNNKEVGLYVAEEGYELWAHRKELVEKKETEMIVIDEKIAEIEQQLLKEPHSLDLYQQLGQLFSIRDKLTKKKEIRIMLDGERKSLKASPVVISGSTYLPAREVAESLGLSVTWNSGKRSILFSNSDRSIEIIPKLINGTSYIPLRLVSDQFGLNVKWQSEGALVLLFSPMN